MTAQHPDLDSLEQRAAHARTEARTKGEPGFAGSFADILKGFRK